MSLSEIIVEKIKKEGPVSFHEFMEMALYYPEYGYYTSAGDKIGKHGDFYTSPYLTSIFGYMIAKQLEEMWCILDKKSFTIVEYGAGEGRLSNDILTRLKSNKQLYDKLNYCIIEKSEVMRQKEKMILHDKVQWFNCISDIPLTAGCILSNEVVDNFPIHQVIMGNELMEVFVDYNNGFVETLQPASETLKNYLDELQVTLPKGFRTEINLQAIEWIKEIASALKAGFVITIDYGYPSSALYNNKRSCGTLVCYHKHSINYCPYTHIGEQDITAHVNFSALRNWGLKNGLGYSGFTTQANFLLALGLTDYLRTMEQVDTNHANNAEKTLLIHTFLMDMGSKFKVLIQHKGIEKPRLSGLQFAQQFV